MRQILFLFIFFLSCSCSKKEDVIINRNFQEIIINYSDSNPIEIPRLNKSEAEELDLIFPEPSYQIFFSKIDSDTIMSIKLMPHLIPHNPIDQMVNTDSETVYDEINPSGYFMIDNNPIIIYDLDNYSNGLIIKDKLSTQIPDSLIFEIGKVNNHIKSPIEYYKISNLDFERISLEKFTNRK